MNTDRVPPHDIDAERALLSCILLKGSSEMLARLSEDDFYRPAHGLIFSACLALSLAGLEIDHLTVADKLGDSLEIAGGKYYLLDLSGVMPTTANWRRYAEIVRRSAKLRRLIAVGTQIVAAAYESPDDADALSSECLSWIMPMQDLGKTRRGTIAALADARIEAYKHPTPYFVAPISGVKLHFGDLTIIAARPGVGKSAYAVQCADVWSTRYKTAFYSFEMTADELTDRIISRRTKQPTEWTYDGISDSEALLIRKHTEDLRDRDLTIIEASGLSEIEMVSSLRAFAVAGGKIAVIDYVQIGYETTKQSENADLTRFSKVLRRTAKSAGIAIVALSQFSRSGDGEEGKITYPRAKHLRGSGSLEQDAANICLMFKYPPAESDLGRSARTELRGKPHNLAADLMVKPDLIRFHWDKVRHGRPELDYGFFRGDSMTFDEIDQENRE